MIWLWNRDQSELKKVSMLIVDEVEIETTPSSDLVTLVFTERKPVTLAESRVVVTLTAEQAARLRERLENKED